MRPSFVSILVLDLSLVGCNAAPVAARSWAGCYQVSVGAWAPDSASPRNRRVLPDTILLRSRALASREGYSLGPNIFGEYHQQIPPVWTVTQDTVHLVWTDTVMGIRVHFASSDSGFTGRAERFEVGRPSMSSPTAPVRLHRVACGSGAAA